MSDAAHQAFIRGPRSRLGERVEGSARLEPEARHTLRAAPEAGAVAARAPLPHRRSEPAWASPDIVLARARVAVFCDGDFWHGRDLERRSDALAKGHNAPYWVAKIRDERGARPLQHPEARRARMGGSPALGDRDPARRCCGGRQGCARRHSTLTRPLAGPLRPPRRAPASRRARVVGVGVGEMPVLVRDVSQGELTNVRNGRTSSATVAGTLQRLGAGALAEELPSDLSPQHLGEQRGHGVADLTLHRTDRAQDDDVVGEGLEAGTSRASRAGGSPSGTAHSQGPMMREASRKASIARASEGTTSTGASNRRGQRPSRGWCGTGSSRLRGWWGAGPPSGPFTSRSRSFRSLVSFRNASHAVRYGESPRPGRWVCCVRGRRELEGPAFLVGHEEEAIAELRHPVVPRPRSTWAESL
jgi:hypothetical protein